MNHLKVDVAVEVLKPALGFFSYACINQCSIYLCGLIKLYIGLFSFVAFKDGFVTL